MSKAAITVELSDPVLQGATDRAEKAGMSMSTWIQDTVAQRVRNEELTEAFYRRRARGGTMQNLLDLMDKGPNLPPIPGDELDAD